METQIKQMMIPVCDNKLKIIMEYFLPLFQITAFLINIFNVAIFFRSKNRLHRTLLANSLVDSIVFLLYVFQTHPLCNRNANFIFTYWYQIYVLFIRLYLLRVMTMVSSLINIKIAIDRYYLTTSGVTKKTIKENLAGFIVCSLVFYLPNIFFNKIYEVDSKLINNETTNSTATHYFYIVYFTETYQKQKAVKIILPLYQTAMIFIYLVVMFVLNVLIYKKYRESRKMVIQNNSACTSLLTDAEKNERNKMTLMVFWISFVFMIDQILTVLYNTANLFLSRGALIHLNFIAVVLFLRVVTSLLNSVFYYIYYNDYRKIINRFFLFLILTLLFILFTITLFYYVIAFPIERKETVNKKKLV